MIRAAIQPGDLFSWLGYTWRAVSISDHCSGRTPIVAHCEETGRTGVPFEDEIELDASWAAWPMRGAL